MVVDAVCPTCGSPLQLVINVRISGSLCKERRAVYKSESTVLSAVCSVCGCVDYNGPTDDVCEELILLTGGNKMDKKSADAANSAIGKTGKLFAAAVKAKVLADNNKSIVVSMLKNEFVAASEAGDSKTISEAAAERLAKADKRYIKACADLAEAECAYTLAYNDLEVARNTFEIETAV